MKHALRSLLKTPGFTLVAVAIIGLGIGSSTALIGAFDALVRHPLSFREPDRLMRIWSSTPGTNFNFPALSWPRFEYFREHQRSFAGMGAAAPTSFAFTRAGVDPEQVAALQVSADFLETLGVEPQLGRNFTRDEDMPGGSRVALISHEFWQTRLGGRQSAVGELIELNGDSYQIIGILPPAVSQPYRNVSILVPRVFETPGPTPQQVQNGAGFIEVTARLKPGVAISQAAEEISVLARRYREAFPARLDGKSDSPVVPFAEELTGGLRPAFRLLLGAVGAVLLIACVNVASLFLGRLSARRKEIALRLSLGATPAQLVKGFLRESFIFCLAAGLCGVLFAQWALACIQQLAGPRLPSGITLQLDAATLGIALALAGIAVFIVGLMPALQAVRTDMGTVLKETTRGATGGSRAVRFRSGLIVVQVMLSVALLAGAGLLLLSFGRLQSTVLGFDPRGLATAFLNIPAARYPTESRQADFFEQLIERLETQPRVRSAAVSLGVPLTGLLPRATYAVHGRPVPPLAERALAQYNLTSEHYFETMRIALREGRLFGPQDNEKSPNVCVINEALARRLFPGQSALGKVLLRGRDAEIKSEIIGVVADVRTKGPGAPPTDDIYYPIRQVCRPVTNLVVRTEGDPAALQALIRSTIAAIDHNQPAASFQTLEALVGRSVDIQRITAWLAGFFAAVSLLLSAVGLYSVLAYITGQRTAEIGIRMALGAQRRDVVAMVLRDGMRLAGLGLGLGLCLAAAGAGLIRSLLYGVDPLDPLVFGGVIFVCAAVAGAACLVPSLRASRVDPLVALRAE